jgi:hypothetical protein
MIFALCGRLFDTLPLASRSQSSHADRAFQRQVLTRMNREESSTFSIDPLPVFVIVDHGPVTHNT